MDSGTAADGTLRPTRQIPSRDYGDADGDEQVDAEVLARKALRAPRPDSLDEVEDQQSDEGWKPLSRELVKWTSNEDWRRRKVLLELALE